MRTKKWRRAPSARRGRIEPSKTWGQAPILALALLAACKSKEDADKLARTADVELVRDGSSANGSSANGADGADANGANANDRGAPANSEPTAWAALAELPHAEPIRVITIPTRPALPRFTVGGPAIQREIAVVSSSQFGFAAVDWRRGSLVWTKPAGIKVAPPVVMGDGFALIGDCVAPPEVPDDEMLLGCLRVVTADGVDQAYLAIHGKKDQVEPFAAAAGDQLVWLEEPASGVRGGPSATGAGARRPAGHAAGSTKNGAVADGEKLRWRRGDQSVLVDPLSGSATPVGGGAGAEKPTPVRKQPPIVVEYKKHRWEIDHIDGKVVATENGKRAWVTSREVTALLGAVWIPGQGPMVRMVNIGGFAGMPEVRILDMDATGSMNGTAAWTPVPGISLLGRAVSPVGDAALAIRADSSIKHDFIAAYAASALLLYVFPLPEVLRADPVGVAIALDEDGGAEAVVAFYDGDQVAVLPNVSAPPTAPGAAAGPLKKPTP